MESKSWVVVMAGAIPVAAVTAVGLMPCRSSRAPLRKQFRQVAHSDP